MTAIVNDIIKKWEGTIESLEVLIAVSNPDDIMMAIMVARKNKLLECIKDINSISNT